MRLTDFILLALLGLAIFGVLDPAGAADLLANIASQVRAFLP